MECTCVVDSTVYKRSNNNQNKRKTKLFILVNMRQSFLSFIFQVFSLHIFSRKEKRDGNSFSSIYCSNYPRTHICTPGIFNSCCCIVNPSAIYLMLLRIYLFPCIAGELAVEKRKESRMENLWNIKHNILYGIVNFNPRPGREWDRPDENRSNWSWRRWWENILNLKR